MSEAPPKIALSLSITMFGGLGVLLIGISIWRHNLPMLMAMAFFCLVLGIGLTRSLSTQLCSSGISQLTWRGRIHLAWSEITQVTRQRQTITLKSAGNRFIVPLVFFSNADAALKFVSSHLPSHLRHE
jgi:hypothetical protein